MCICTSVCMYVARVYELQRDPGRTSDVAVVEQAADVIVLQQGQQQSEVGSRQQVRATDQHLTVTVTQVYVCHNRLSNRQTLLYCITKILSVGVLKS